MSTRNLLGLLDEEISKLHVAVADQQVMLYAYWRLLKDLVGTVENPVLPTDESVWRVRELVTKEAPRVRDLLVCQCGHVNADHDDSGVCNYIACRNSCLRGNDG